VATQIIKSKKKKSEKAQDDKCCEARRGGQNPWRFNYLRCEKYISLVLNVRSSLIKYKKSIYVLSVLLNTRYSPKIQE
jgi:hypothetical protein